MSPKPHISQINRVIAEIGATTKDLATLNVDYPNAQVGEVVFSDTERYEKTPTTWSITSNTAGPQGPAGPAGPVGPQGPAGTNGVDGVSCQVVGSKIDPATPNTTVVNATSWGSATLQGATPLAINEGAIQFWSMEIRRDLPTTLFEVRLIVEEGNGNGYNEIMIEEALHLEDNKWTTWQYQALIRYDGTTNWRLEIRKLQAGGVLEVRRRTTSFIKSPI